MGWFPQIESRLREIRMMIPEIRVVIADGEPVVLGQLRLLLAEESGVDVVAECSNGFQTIAAVRAHQPYLLLLDADMCDSDGFQVLNGISPTHAPIVVVTSTSDRHATRAFEARAL